MYLKVLLLCSNDGWCLETKKLIDIHLPINYIFSKNNLLLLFEFVENQFKCKNKLIECLYKKTGFDQAKPETPYINTKSQIFNFNIITSNFGKDSPKHGKGS